MMGSACTCRYLIISLLLQRPIRLMMSWSTPKQSKAMAPAACRDLAETSWYVNPRQVPAKSFTVALRWAVILGGVTFNHWPRGDLNWARGVSAGASWCLRCITRLRKASLGHNRGVPCGPMAISPPSHDIFLSAEGEDNEGGRGEVIVGGS